MLPPVEKHCARTGTEGAAGPVRVQAGGYPPERGGPGGSGKFVRRARAVVHLNIANFSVAVERQADAGLRGRPVVVAGCGGRALVHDMSEEAYQSGVRKQMPLSLAAGRCPDAVVLPPHPELYGRVMREMLREMRSYSPRVEAGETDGHLYIDITGTTRLFGPPADVARHMYRDIRRRFGFSPIYALASSKLVSKVASRRVKPVGEYVVGNGEESAFFFPLPVGLLPGIEENERLRLADFNLFTAGDVANLGAARLEAVFGERAGFIFDTVRGIDTSPVRPAGVPPEKIGASCPVGAEGGDIRLVEGVLYGMVETIGAVLRGRGKAARTLSMGVDYADGMCCYRRLSVCPPSAADIDLFETARALLRMAWTRRVRLRHVYLSCPKPVPFQRQRMLFESAENAEKNYALARAVDGIRNRFGWNAVRMGRTLRTGPGKPPEKPADSSP